MSVSTMKRLTVFAFHKDSDKILRKLMNLRCVEIRTLDVSDAQLALKRLRSEEDLARAERQLADIRATIPVLTKYSSRKNGLGRVVHEVDPARFAKDGSEEKAREAVRKTLDLQERIKTAQAEITKAETLSQALLPWMDYDAPVVPEGTKTTITFLGSCPRSVDPEAVENRMNELCATVEPVSEDQRGTYYVVTCFRDDEAEINAALTGFGFLRTEFEGVEGTAQQAYQNATDRCATLEAEVTQCEDALRDVAERLDEVEILSDIEETNRTVAMLHQKLAQTGACTVMDGWIPDFTQDAVSEKLDRFDCAYEIGDPEPDEEPPVLLRNNRFAINFEWVVGMYAYPKYGRFDPTFIMSIFYFLIFGLMFADVGYGLLLVVGCFGGIKLLNPRPGMRRMLYMFGYCGISAIIMGLIFGGWFGDLPTALMQNLFGVSVDTVAGHFFGSGLWFNPLEKPTDFLVVSIGFGFIHLVAGMAVHFFILCRDKKVGEAICTILPYWVLFAGVLVMLLAQQTVGLILCGVGAGMILLLNGYGIRNPIKRLIKGLGGLYGLVNYVSDLLSYSRILALALVAAVIAKVINMMAAFGKGGVVGVIVMILALTLGHLLNLAINLLGAFVHTSRLQYLEFFGKFYEDGGTPFEPVTPADKYSEITESDPS